MTAHFFGYGSLVNHRTHSYRDPRRARLHGWRRTWCLTPLRPEVFLSARPVEGTSIDGLIAAVPDRDWAALDLRETGYVRHDVSVRLDHDLGSARDVQVYSVPRDDLSGGVILLSYLDVVVQGYLHHYGESGATAFFETTDGWARDVLDDRAAPQYPRAQHLSGPETAFVDAMLAALPVRLRALYEFAAPPPGQTPAA